MPEYLCKLTSVPSTTNPKLRLQDNNFSTVAGATGDTNSITFQDVENLNNYLDKNCVSVKSLDNNGYGMPIISFIFFVVLVAIIVYYLMPNNSVKTSFGLAKNSFSF